jgi:hypothetical protein
VKPLRRTGSSANITYYAEPTSAHGDIWAEVLRSDHDRRLRPDRPRFYVRVHRIGTGEVARYKYCPRKQMPPGPLAAKQVTRIVREALKSCRAT